MIENEHHHPLHYEGQKDPTFPKHLLAFLTQTLLDQIPEIPLTLTVILIKLPLSGRKDGTENLQMLSKLYQDLQAPFPKTNTLPDGAC